MKSAPHLNPPNYQKTPLGIMKVLQLFHHYHFNYILFKCEHIFAGENKNLDILFETDREYLRAGRLLENAGFTLRFSEKMEKYKKMYCFLDKEGSTISSIHFHREIAWHGVKALDKKYVFQRKKILHPLIIIPSLEDSLLIHAAHVLFENFRITEKEGIFFDQTDYSVLDQNYLKMQLRRNNWENGFIEIMKRRKSKELFLSKSKIIKIWSRKLIFEPLTTLYLSKKIFRKIFRSFDWRRKGCLISLIGVNGSGKTTLAKSLLHSFQPLTEHLGIKQQYYYFGWKPEFFLTRFLSKLFHQRSKKLFQELNFQKKNKKFDLFQEILFLYIFLEFYYRHLFILRPKLKSGGLLVTDRYFYDIYGQYQYAQNSLLLKLLLKIFPSPDFTYVLDVEVPELLRRGKTNKDNLHQIESLSRKVMPWEYLQDQRNRYLFLSRYLGKEVINTSFTTQKCVEHIIQQSWKELL